MSGRVDVRDTLDTWPSLSVTIETAPWHWAWLPRIYNDWDCTSSCSVAWLFLKVEWFANRPLLPLEREGCDCTELCPMGPTCPGGMLAGLPGSGCWRTETP